MSFYGQGVIVEMQADIAVRVFRTLHQKFFKANGEPIPFFLRDKANTQDDPLDEHISQLIADAMQPRFECIKSNPLTSPDMVVFDKHLEGRTLTEEQLKEDLDKVLAIEVKKVESNNGLVARATGMDYNSTPPSSHVIIYDRKDKPFLVRCFYLFISTVPTESTGPQGENTIVTSLVLCDGAALNTDVELYKSIVAPREKELNLGSYGDGALRSRPMLIFPNPLGVNWLRQTPSLIHKSPNLEHVDKDLCQITTIKRTLVKDEGKYNLFYCYQDRRLVNYNGDKEVTDPFPLPAKRKLGQRGKLHVPLNLE